MSDPTTAAVATTPAHSQRSQHSYIIAYPAHDPRTSDPHYKDFNAYRSKTKATAVCAFGDAIHDFNDCGGGMELHHGHIEFAMLNAINFKHLEAEYPGISNPDIAGAWIEGAKNLVWLCEKHHRSAAGGVHSLTASDYEASRFVMAIFSADPKQTAPVDSEDNVSVVVDAPSAVVESSQTPTPPGESNGS